MTRLVYCVAPLLASLVLASCQQASTAPPGTNSQRNPALSDGSSFSSSVGVAECDDYLSKYQACVAARVPESARAAFTHTLDQTRVAWRRASDSPGGKEGLSAACKQAREASKVSLRFYGCTDF